MSITGFFVRVQRDGRFQNLDVAELTDNELDAFFRGRDADSLLRWVVGLAAWIRGNVKVVKVGESP